MSVTTAHLSRILVAVEDPAAQGTSFMDRFTEWVVTVMEMLGAPGVGLLVALENLFPPIPSELILPLAGFTASLGEMSLISAIAWATIGSVVGAIVLYWVGRAFGHERITGWAAKLPLVDPADVDRTVAWFSRHGKKAVFFGRMIPIFRSLISIPAGIERMSQSTFILLTMSGSLIWNTVFVVLGFWVGENYAIIETYAGWFQKAVVVVVGAAVVWWIVKRVRRTRARQGADPGEGPAAD
ncbi:DedA family protein [Brevibacterium senegalense]|uniref:DedA family protein n=1 Tax=Brevibacterium senegalense TaxID=1033736 RepID=UPI0002F96399|nr:DedA family protein [Brevibacterium senegalense]